MYTRIEDVEMTCFEKVMETSIEDINVGDIFYVKLYDKGNSFSYFGMLLKKTDKFFDAIYYCSANSKTGKTRTDYYMKKSESNKRRFAKSRIMKVYSASIGTRLEQCTITSNYDSEEVNKV